MQVDLQVIADLQSAIAVGDLDKAKKIAEANPEMIDLAAKQTREFMRRGQPASTRAKGWLEDIRYVAGIKFGLTDVIPAITSVQKLWSWAGTAYRFVRG